MSLLTLTIEPRSVLGKRTRRLRASGKLPAVLYGKREASTPIELSVRDFERVYKEAGESTVIRLEGLSSPKDALVSDIDVDPVTGALRHADFYVFEKGQRVSVTVPLEYVGVSPAVKDLGGTLVKVMHEIEVEAEPANLPHKIDVDISSLIELDDQIPVRDLALPAGANVTPDAEDVVALVTLAKEESKEEEAPMDLSQIEVEKKGKEEEDSNQETGSANQA